MYRKVQKPVKYVTNVTNVQSIIISYMLIPQITNKYYFETVMLHGGNSERNEKAFYWKAESLNNFK
jgi:ATP-dependent RNA circularization protein (DNA/RNA ligase family)